MKLRGCRAKGMTERRATGRRLHVRVSEGRVGIVRAVGLKGRIVMQTPRLDLGRGGLAACKCPEQDSDPRGQTLVPATAAGSLPPPGGGHASGETPLPTTTTDGQRRAPGGSRAGSRPPPGPCTHRRRELRSRWPNSWQHPEQHPLTRLHATPPEGVLGRVPRRGIAWSKDINTRQTVRSIVKCRGRVRT